MALSERTVARNEGRAGQVGVHLRVAQREGAKRSGWVRVPVGTEYHWYILAHQRVRKIDADSYTTFMSGLKYKVAHKRPHWRKWSSEYPEQPSERQRLTAILEETLEGMRGAHLAVGPAPVEPSRSPSLPRGPRTSYEAVVLPPD